MLEVILISMLEVISISMWVVILTLLVSMLEVILISMLVVILISMWAVILTLLVSMLEVIWTLLDSMLEARIDGTRYAGRRYLGGWSLLRAWTPTPSTTRG